VVVLCARAEIGQLLLEKNSKLEDDVYDLQQRLALQTSELERSQKVGHALRIARARMND